MNSEDNKEISKLTGGYIGTEIDEKWWRRYKENGFFMRGNGEGELTENGLSFRRYLTKDPLIIPYKNITGITFGKWHAGKWLAGKPVLKLHWTAEGDARKLCAGFYFKLSENQLQRLVETIKKKANI
mgnify:CR=1 FL=1|tara:strand:- start:1731 stop:2111 length:381 start_codon:yes stop_codon:yes gene_type:complete